MNFTIDPAAALKFDSYPVLVKRQMNALRELIREVAVETEDVSALEETLKWGEPAFLTKKGSTVRMDWKQKAPDQYAVYFKCTSKLVSTFREVYGDLFRYEKNRAIVFSLTEEIPRTELKDCLRMALRYHSLKHLPLLGAEVKE